MSIAHAQPSIGPTTHQRVLHSCLCPMIFGRRKQTGQMTKEIIDGEKSIKEIFTRYLTALKQQCDKQVCHLDGHCQRNNGQSKLPVDEPLLIEAVTFKY